MGGNVLHETSGSQDLYGDQAGPLTFDRYSRHVLAGYVATGNVKPVHVQVRKRGVVLCGKVLEASEGRQGTDWFKVDTYLGQNWFPDQNVRLCSGDGRCMCEEPAGADGRACATAASAGAVPLGNTGTTVGAQA
jgi:hypothetical protein